MSGLYNYDPSEDHSPVQSTVYLFLDQAYAGCFIMNAITILREALEKTLNLGYWWSWVRVIAGSLAIKNDHLVV